MGQPIIRGIQAVGGVNIWYRYNNAAGLQLPATIQVANGVSSLAKTGEGSA